MPAAKTAWDPKVTPYPKARRTDEMEEFKSATRGTVKVAAPYEWLNDPDSAETVQFVNDQAEFTANYLDKFEHKQKFKEKLEEVWDYAKFSAPSRNGDYYYFSYNSGLQAQSPIYRFPVANASSLPKEGEIGGELFFDSNVLSADGTVARSTSSFSDDGKYWAYALSRSGSDWTTIHVRETASPHREGGEVGKDEGRLDDVLRFVKFSSIGWTKDGKGFFYQGFPKREKHEGVESDAAGTETDADLNAELRYHKLGTPQSEDLLIHKDAEHPEWMFGAGATEDGKYIIMSQSKDTARSNLLWIASLEEAGGDVAKLKWNKLINTWGTYWADVANDGSLFYFYTNADGADKYKIVKYNLANPDHGFTDVVAHNPDALLESYHVFDNNKLLIQYSVDVKDELHLFDLASGEKRGRVAEGVLGTVGQITGHREDKEFWVSYTSFTNPTTVYRYQVENGKGQELSTYRQTVVPGIVADDFVTEQVWYNSKDGTRIPMYIVRPKDVKVDGTAPALVYGYAGFSISLNASFRPAVLTFLKHFGAVYAQPNLRGGGEFGESWHEAGTKERKQNVFDDFHAATEYLVDNKYAAKDKVAINGGSNGGLLVGACMNQRPELYGAALAEVGVLDMLRFHRFTIGRAWTSDYGSSDDPAGFDYLYAYSPLENVPTDKVLPPTMLLTADHDDRVVPLHSFKHAAALQHAQPDNPNPLLLRVDLKAGHGAGKSTQKVIEEAVSKYGFLVQAMGLEWRD